MIKESILIILVVSFISVNCKKEEKFRITDLHVHLKGGFTIQDAVKKSEAENVRYGIALVAGVKFTVGINNTDGNFTEDYAREIIKKCKLVQQDFYQPVNKRQNGQH